MNIAGIYKADVGNGSGMRVSLFVSGCTLKCKGCFNEKAQDFSYGKLWTPELEEELIEELSKSFYKGLTILGGEPFELLNQPGVASVVERVRKTLPEKDIWIYTGNVYEKNFSPEGDRYMSNVTDYILDNIDVLVDGPFMKDGYDPRLNFRGSKNQRIIDMKRTRAEGDVILHPLNNII